MQAKPNYYCVLLYKGNTVKVFKMYSPFVVMCSFSLELWRFRVLRSVVLDIIVRLMLSDFYSVISNSEKVEYVNKRVTPSCDGHNPRYVERDLLFRAIELSTVLSCPLVLNNLRQAILRLIML